MAALRAENARLAALLEAHGIEWRLPPEAAPVITIASEPSRFSTAEKVALFRRLFRGRTDVYPVRWESKSSGADLTNDAPDTQKKRFSIDQALPPDKRLPTR